MEEVASAPAAVVSRSVPTLVLPDLLSEFVSQAGIADIRYMSSINLDDGELAVPGIASAFAHRESGMQLVLQGATMDPRAFVAGVTDSFPRRLVTRPSACMRCSKAPQ